MLDRHIQNVNMTRRLVMGCISASFTLGILKPLLDGQVQPQPAGNFAVTAITVNRATELWKAMQDGTADQQIIGRVLAVPQSCAAGRPGYSATNADPGLHHIYLGTSEWIREIIYTADPIPDDQTYRKYRRLLGFYRVSNDAHTSGCGHISKNVALTKVSLQANDVLKETSDPIPYSSFAFGNQDGAVYLADKIFIFPGEWSLVGGKPIKITVDEMNTPKRPLDVSACPG